MANPPSLAGHGTGGVGDDMRKFLEAAQEDAVEAQEVRTAVDVRCCRNLDEFSK